MRKSLACAVATFIALLAPAAAEAHHAEGTADCDDATINLIGFGSEDKSEGVDITVKPDWRPSIARHVSPNEFPGSNKTVTVPYPAPPNAGTHTVQVNVTWETSSGSFSRTFSGCTPPPLSCGDQGPNGGPVSSVPPCPPPSGTPGPSCGGQGGPPCSTPAPPSSPSTPVSQPVRAPARKKHRCPSSGRYSITVTPKHQLHGLVRFRLNGPHVRRVRWFVNHKRRGTHAYPNRAPYERTSGKGGRIYHVFLWAKPVWGDALYGFHQIAVRLTVGNGHGRRCQVSKQVRYKNWDPPAPGKTTKGRRA